jgi:hypothetical protein
VKRKARLGQVQIGHQITHTALSTGEGLYQIQPQRIRQGFEQLASLLVLQGLSCNQGRQWHATTLRRTGRQPFIGRKAKSPADSGSASDQQDLINQL